MHNIQKAVNTKMKISLTPRFINIVKPWSKALSQQTSQLNKSYDESYERLIYIHILTCTKLM